jgi:hypothetical protein
MSNPPGRPARFTAYIAGVERNLRQMFQLRAAHASVEREVAQMLADAESLATQYEARVKPTSAPDLDAWIGPELVALAAQADVLSEVVKYYLRLLDETELVFKPGSTS